MFWTKEDILQYIKENKIEISSIYNTIGISRTGCMFCAFGVHLAKPNKFQLMHRTHPKQWKYCMDKLGMRKVLEYLGVQYDSNDLLF